MVLIFCYKYLDVIVNRTTNLAVLFPKKERTAISTATNLYVYFTRYNLFDAIWSDPGSDLTSEVIEQLEKWLDKKHRFTIPNQHGGHGVERINGEIIRHLRAMVLDERIIDRWSEPLVICNVEYLLNSNDSVETGVIPFEATFGS